MASVGSGPRQVGQLGPMGELPVLHGCQGEPGVQHLGLPGQVGELLVGHCSVPPREPEALSFLGPGTAQGGARHGQGEGSCAQDV